MSVLGCILYLTIAACLDQAIVALLEGRLRGGGAVLRHLASLGYRLQHEQSALHEFDFSVGCMATELRDGIRLCKLLEVLAGGHTLRPSVSDAILLGNSVS